ncbi:MAG: WXG100 family type VII secretion target [Lachnospiraceae bacterium]|nr:WXG100 family type VII secretion target [Lachnospiraceae bacterium]
MALTIDPKQIAAIAEKIRLQNEQLDRTLTDSQTAVRNLKGVWTGQAADATIGAFDDFARKYFENYKEMLNRYVLFLNKAASEGYAETETKVESLADEI